jgi:hypothetical protein
MATNAPPPISIPATSPSPFTVTGGVGITASVQYFAATIGTITVTDKSGNAFYLSYGGVGATWSPFPGLPAEVDVTTAECPSPGQGFLVASLNTGINNPRDFMGPFRMFTAGANGPLIGVNGGIIIFGGSDSALAITAAAAAMATPLGLALDMKYWKGAVLSAGMQMGTPQAGSISAFVGHILAVQDSNMNVLDENCFLAFARGIDDWLTPVLDSNGNIVDPNAQAADPPSNDAGTQPSPEGGVPDNTGG